LFFIAFSGFSKKQLGHLHDLFTDFGQILIILVEF
jgi:hypothetical protein